MSPLQREALRALFLGGGGCFASLLFCLRVAGRGGGERVHPLDLSRHHFWGLSVPPQCRVF
jgi:hypothetical protein